MLERRLSFHNRYRRMRLMYSEKLSVMSTTAQLSAFVLCYVANPSVRGDTHNEIQVHIPAPRSESVGHW